MCQVFSQGNMRVFRPYVGSAGLCRGRKKSTGWWATECRQPKTAAFAAGFFLFSAAVFDKSLNFVNFIGLPAFDQTPPGGFS
jgi:hypothetical protein